jgi:glutaredoxin 3
MSIRVYITDYCPYCVAAKQLLDRKGWPYETIDVTNDPERRAWLVQATGQRTVPQVFVGERSLGGYTDMLALDQAGELEPLVLADTAP